MGTTATAVACDAAGHVGERSARLSACVAGSII
jgi:hypothetical protein